MKILFTRFPLESTLGGAEIQTLRQMEGLMARGHAVAFAGSCPVLLAECRKRGIPAVSWDIGKPPVTKHGAVSFGWRRGKMRQKLEQLLGQFEALDAIAMLSLSEKLLLTDIAAKKGIRTYWIEHDRVGRWLTHNPWLPMLRDLSAQAITITVSELSRNIYLKLGWNKERVVAIVNGVDELRGTRSELRDSKLHIGCIARLSPEKGIDVLIEAMAAVPDRVTLEVVGEGRVRAHLQSLISKLHLEKRVTLAGREDDLAAVYGRIDALVLPSRDNDPFGLVAAEAMLLGIPVIVTDACGIADYLTHGRDALIVEAGSPSSLSNAIRTLLDDDLRIALAQKGYETASEKFSVKCMVDSYETVFTDASLFSRLS